MAPRKDDLEFTEKDAEARDKLLRDLLATPPQPRPKRERAKGSRAARKRPKATPDN
jgi:hypothetical protein